MPVTVSIADNALAEVWSNYYLTDTIWFIAYQCNTFTMAECGLHTQYTAVPLKGEGVAGKVEPVGVVMVESSTTTHCGSLFLSIPGRQSRFVWVDETAI